MKTAPVSGALVPVVVNKHDSHFGIWFEHVDEPALRAFRLVKALLNRRGYRLAEDPNINKNYKSLNPTHRLGIRDGLEVAVTVSGRHVEVLFFQNLHNVENRSGGRYDFDKLQRMPYLMRLRVEMEFRKLTDVLSSNFAVTVRAQPAGRPMPTGLTSQEVIEQRSRASCHYRAELGRADWNGDYNRRTADGQLLDQGTSVYFTDLKGRWQQGAAFYNLNNMWWVACGKYGLMNKSSFELHVAKPELLRRKDNRKYSLKRIEALIGKAVERQDYLAAHQLKTVRDIRLAPVG